MLWLKRGLIMPTVVHEISIHYYIHTTIYFCLLLYYFLLPLFLIFWFFDTHVQYIEYMYAWSLIICPPDIRFSMDKQGHWRPFFLTYFTARRLLSEKNFPKNEKNIRWYFKSNEAPLNLYSYSYHCRDNTVTYL